MIVTETEVLITSPTVERFEVRKMDACRACDLHLNAWDRLMAALKGVNPGVHQAKFCEGGKAPTETKGMMQAMMSGEHEVFNPCAGVNIAHLHVRCNRCGFVFLMATKHPIARAE